MQTMQQPEVSPYYRYDLGQGQQHCPNCGVVVDTEELQKVSIRCIARSVKKQEQQQRAQLLAKTPSSSADGGGGNNSSNNGNSSPARLVAQANAEGQMPEELQSAFSNTDTIWTPLPPVLSRLKRQPHQLFDPNNKIGDKIVRLCQACHEQFCDDDEQDFQANLVRKSMQLRAEAEVQGRRSRKPQNGVVPSYCERKANRQKDMVFSDQQVQIRDNDRELARKKQWRRRFVTEGEDQIEWGTVPASATVLKEMKHYQASRPVAKFTHPDRRVKKPKAPPKLGLTHPIESRYLPASQQALPYALPVVGPGSSNLAQMTATLANSANSPSAGNSVLKAPPLGDIDWTPQHQQVPSPSSKVGGGLVMDLDLLPPQGVDQQGALTIPQISESEMLTSLQCGEEKTYFEVGYASRLCFELWQGMCKATRYGKHCPDNEEDTAEDIPTSDPFFTVYRRNQKRFPEPPEPNLITDEESAADGGAQEQLTASAQEESKQNTAQPSAAQDDPDAEGMTSGAGGDGGHVATTVAAPSLLDGLETELLHLLDEEMRFVDRSRVFHQRTSKIIQNGVDDDLVEAERGYLKEILSQPAPDDEAGGANEGGANGGGNAGQFGDKRGSHDGDDDEEDEDEEEIEDDDGDSLDHYDGGMM